jgi:hypothetical protein
LIELQAARTSTTLPARYQTLGFEFATTSKKKLTFATGSAEDFGIYYIYGLIGLIAFRTI